MNKIFADYFASVGSLLSMRPFYILPIILAMSASLALVSVGVMPVRSEMEARNLQTAQEIMQQGNWLLPTLNGRVRIKKPPLPTWALAVMGKITGKQRDLFYLRLPNVFMGLLALVFTFLLAKDLYGVNIAFFATAILMTSTQFIGEMYTARWDLSACSFAIGALWATCRALRTPIQPGYIFIAALLWGASYLSKGPIDFYVMLLPFFMALLTTWWLSKRKDVIFPGDSSAICNHLLRIFPVTLQQWCAIAAILLLSLLIGNSWWVAVWFKYPETWRELYQDLRNLNLSHRGAYHFYFTWIFAWIAPWTLFLLIACIYNGKKLLFLRKLLNKNQSKVAISESILTNITMLLPFLWFLFGLLLLCIFPAKKSRYFLPLLPVIAILLATIVQQLQMQMQQDISQNKLLAKILYGHRLLLAIATMCMPVILFVLNRYGATPLPLILSPLFLLVAIIAFRKSLNVQHICAITTCSMFIFVLLIFICLSGIKNFLNDNSQITMEIIQDRYRNAKPVKQLTQNMELHVCC